ncbi:Lactosylceramide 4-alpha-galactosyltransferase [Staphylotrichum tortipilum]|uniref:Lactosylceramide 4-alpha-galactosyltransferase n=1 Tax=Staphylotrichum tortipilum TaxID=2831512 RepID=A0AAN6RP61_9PEZI|nr:Lactosylceramide 4-alpha-galactosyltransferase [Staphylotrichum longicolle]
MSYVYSRLQSTSSRASRSLCTRPRLFLAVLTLLIASVLVVGGHYLVWGTRVSYRTFQFTSIADTVCDDVPNTSPVTATTTNPPTIPNLVHYVWLLKDPSELRLTFKVFISIYSAHLFWQPERIYIHTDATPSVIEHARANGTPWTRRILAIPNLIFHHIDVPMRTAKGVEIKWTEHKADFLRLAALREFGGVYLDTDAIPLRDAADLRASGFRNVVGQQLGLAVWATNYLNNGVMMAARGSTLMTLFHHAAHEFFDGEWDTASIRLLTDLGNRLAAIPGEVLILQPQAFSPLSWQEEDQKRLFLPTLDPATAAPVSGGGNQTGLVVGRGTCKDVLAWVKQRERREREAGELDLSSSYVLHAFDNGFEDFLGKGKEIDVGYVLDRRSNYARAVFPAVWHAVQEGVIPKEEVRWQTR